MQHLFSPETYRNRRQKLAQKVGEGVILILANEYSPMNYRGNVYRYRQDSNFLYFFGLSMPGIAGVVDIDQNKSILFGDDATMEDIVWTGPVDSVQALAASVGMDQVKSMSELKDYLSGKQIHFLPQYRMGNAIHLGELLDRQVADIKTGHSVELVKSVVDLRSVKSDEEVAQMEEALVITKSMHEQAIATSKSGMKESVLSGISHGVTLANDCDLAYPIILSKHGHILHNHAHHNTLLDGDIVVADMGSENKMFYASDITRTFPVSDQFTERQKEIYRIVLDAEEECIKMCRPGIAYRDVHLHASKIIASGLKHLGLMQGDVDEAVAAGAHAMFFPHGLGHMIGLDVHDMEDLGEDLVGYDDQIRRSDQFGTAYLRLGRALQPGFVITVEPGIYLIPQLIEMWGKEKKHEAFINYTEVEKWKDFGGVRIEDNVLITTDGHRVLGPPIAKAIDEIESLKRTK